MSSAGLTHRHNRGVTAEANEAARKDQAVTPYSQFGNQQSQCGNGPLQMRAVVLRESLLIIQKGVNQFTTSSIV